MFEIKSPRCNWIIMDCLKAMNNMTSNNYVLNYRFDLDNYTYIQIN